MSTGFILLANTIQWRTTFYLQGEASLKPRTEEKTNQYNMDLNAKLRCGQKEENGCFKARNWTNKNQEHEEQEEEERTGCFFILFSTGCL